MPNYRFRFTGRERDEVVVDCEDVDAARNEAVRSLGAYLSEHPGFADEGHWRIEVESEQCEPLLHVIVATVNVRPRR
ncbi:DUF6894 family protein [Sphingomonas aerophila]|uniref:DUF6894 domain-containing protein n=1 Tax=Sphingomonas aerophila TaxID=1344948 RepID=A0A7W9BBK1_9SPHN|nr:hypothetical protein [Sphingomonas aerophila]MBB5714183.1 hypothetical protein [Sphingomonas aerophila]